MSTTENKSSSKMNGESGEAKAVEKAALPSNDILDDSKSSTTREREHKQDRDRDSDRDRHRDRDRDKNRDRRRRSRSRDRSRSRSRDRGDRNRDRDRRRSRRRSRSRSNDGPKAPAWMFDPNRRRNFDIRPEQVDQNLLNAQTLAAHVKAGPGANGNIGGGMFPGAAMGGGGNIGGGLLMGGHGAGNFGGGAGGGANAGIGHGVDGPGMQQTRHARRLYVGGIPPNTTEEEVTTFFNVTINKALRKPSDSKETFVLSVYINHERAFSFVELTSIELTSACMQLDGICFRKSTDPNTGQTMTHHVKVRRPNDYNPQALHPSVTQRPLPSLDLAALGIIATTVPDSEGKIFVGGLPYHLSEEQVRELLSAFGQLRSFHLVRDPGSVTSKGYGFCEFCTEDATRAACDNLNGLQLGDKTLTVRIAVSKDDNKPANSFPSGAGAGGGAGQVNHAAVAMGLSTALNFNMNHPQVNPMNSMQMMMPNAYGQFAPPPPPPGPGPPQGPIPIPVPVPAGPPSCVVRLSNMVVAADLVDDEEFLDIKEDVEEECSKYGKVNAIVIPRPPPKTGDNGDDGAKSGGGGGGGVGNIYIELATVAAAETVCAKLGGRKFDSRQVVANYYDENKFRAAVYE